MPLGAIALLALSPSARAHSLGVDAFVEPGNSVTIEAYYGDGKPVAAAAVRVRGEGGQEIRAGQTDADGRFRFRPPTADPLTVEVVQAGHKGTARIDKDMLAQLAGSAGPAQSQPVAMPSPSARSAAGAERVVQTAPVVRSRAGGNPIIPAIAGIALILSMAGWWRIRTLSRQIEQLRKQLESQGNVRHH